MLYRPEQKRNAKILLVEDEHKYSVPLRKFFLDNHLSVELAETEQNFYLALHQRHSLDLIVFDILLKDETTINPALERIISARRLYPALPILVYSQHVDLAWHTRLLAAGTSKIVTKPLEITHGAFYEVLLPQIEELLRNSQTQAIIKYAQLLRKLTEDELIDEIIIPLFYEMGYTSLKRIGLHGPGEYGRDVLPFYKIGDFGERYYCAVQVKRARINATSTSHANVTNVIRQAETALIKRFLDADNNSRGLDKLYIVASNGVSQDARAILDDYLNNTHRISLIDASKLLDWLAAHNLTFLLQAIRSIDKVRVVPVVIQINNRLHLDWWSMIPLVLQQLPKDLELDSDLAYRALRERERMMWTTQGDAIAFPHAYGLTMKEYTIVICMTERATMWDKNHKLPVNCAICFLAPRVEISEAHDIKLAVMGCAYNRVLDDCNVNASPGDKLGELGAIILAELKKRRLKAKKAKTLTIVV